MTENHDKPLDHEYDGIQELDNPLPGWWLATFYGAIVFSIFYVGYYHFGQGPSLRQELAAEMASIQQAQKAADPAAALPTEEELMALMSDESAKKIGAESYARNCASCHAPDGGGLIGPNLTDRFWIHGNGKLVAIAQVVADGVAEKGMPPWKAILKPAEMGAVVAYVGSLRGHTPANPKAAQGVEAKE